MNKQIAITTLAIILILFGAFYWFQIRPAHIRQECQKFATGVMRFSYNDEPGASKREKLDNDIFTNTYKNCLHGKGLE